MELVSQIGGGALDPRVCRLVGFTRPAQARRHFVVTEILR
jgi:hypothetical protein